VSRCEECGSFIESEKETVRITYGKKRNSLFWDFWDFIWSIDAWFHLRCLVDIERIEVDDDDRGSVSSGSWRKADVLSALKDGASSKLKDERFFGNVAPQLRV